MNIGIGILTTSGIVPGRQIQPYTEVIPARVARYGLYRPHKCPKSALTTIFRRAPVELDQAIQRATEIAKNLHGRGIKAGLSSRLFAACFAVSQQHHNYVLVLLARNPPLQAMACALLRLLIESTIRDLCFYTLPAMSRSGTTAIPERS